MQILLAFIVGAVIGAALHFLVPGRSTRGVALGPIVGAAAAGLVWMILTWAGVGLDSPWLWLSACACAWLWLSAWECVCSPAPWGWFVAEPWSWPKVRPCP